VPGAVSVVGFDDDEQTPWLDPPLTTMRQPLFEIGWSAAQGALRLIDGEDAQLPVFVPELILRESTGPPPSS
jgi:DNA-binding LacI/PurR family transcriptional regulator